MQSLSNIFWLGVKDLRTLSKDLMMILFIIYSFGLSIYMQSTGAGETVNNASVAIVDEDHSSLSRSIAGLFYPPYFQAAKMISAADIDRGMDNGLYTLVVVIPPHFEADVRKGRDIEVQVNADATAVQQASLGSGYIQNMVTDEVTRYRQEAQQTTGLPSDLVVRRAFNANGTQSWFRAIVGLADQLSMLIIILTGAALLREREHGTIEHLLVMPLTAFEIALAKVWSSGLVIFIGFICSLLFVVEGLLDVPIAGSRGVLLLGTLIYIFATAAIGIFLGTLARTMAQFALLMMMAVMPMMMLSGGMSPIESQPQWVQYVTWFFPSRHYVSFMQAIVYRGAGLDIVWKEFVTVLVMGVTFIAMSLLLFRQSVATLR
ncbi:ABC transporter permease [Pseudomonas veronii]|jgi:ABC-2 type transport system permease protein|uniref:Inner membrane transport permease YhhJ n=1 Tax=Pseudomonas veronii 1YdBTEX2 TaxID=1295141 RepID=A0A1D3K349_PSEVE|nr:MULTISPECIES: ABC transporter permease [Pseudomonas]MBJ2178814.1 ABC transporter permease [Pseudomonas veronii]MCI1737610.1 ABC transporter permease [Pseudomonas veronii]MDF3237871.1 ABC transporter permease [Pseudomonas veronii]MDY7555056.1 ABC transporter permease [Pseudomonas sp. FG1]MEB0050405.1 ABC transporter permease [Pseudomonas sp. FG1]